MKKVAYFLLIFIFSIILLNACNIRSNKLVIGLVPSNSPEEMVSAFEPIRNYLEKEMKMEIEVIVPQDYFGLIELMKNKKIDIGWYGAFSYVMAEKEMDLEPLLIQYRKGFGTSYQSLIIAHKESNLKNIEDLQDKIFTFVDPGSTSGFIVPSALFKSRHIDVQKYFSEVKYSGSHDLVPFNILNKEADAGAMEDLTFNRMINDGKINKDDFVILWKSDKIPGSPFIARTDLNDDYKEKFKTSMLSIHEDAAEAVKSFDERIEKYVEFENSIYNGIRNIANILGDEFIEERYLKTK